RNGNTERTANATRVRAPMITALTEKKMDCQEWKRTYRLCRTAGTARNTIAGRIVKYATDPNKASRESGSTPAISGSGSESPVTARPQAGQKPLISGMLAEQ